MTPLTVQQLTHYRATCYVHHMGQDVVAPCHMDVTLNDDTQWHKWTLTLDSVNGTALLQPAIATWVSNESNADGSKLYQSDIYGAIKVVPLAPALRSYYSELAINPPKEGWGAARELHPQHLEVAQGDNNTVKVTVWEPKDETTPVNNGHEPSLNWLAQHEADVLTYGSK